MGIESVRPAVLDANRNAVINGIVNARYVCGKAEEELPRLLASTDPEDDIARIVRSADVVLLDPPFRGGTLEKILPAVDKCTAPGGTVLCESETGLVLPAQVGGLTLQKQYKYGKVLLWKYTKPMQQEGEAL